MALWGGPRGGQFSVFSPRPGKGQSVITRNLVRWLENTLIKLLVKVITKVFQTSSRWWISCDVPSTGCGSSLSYYSQLYSTSVFHDFLSSGNNSPPEFNWCLKLQNYFIFLDFAALLLSCHTDFIICHVMVDPYYSSDCHSWPLLFTVIVDPNYSLT